MTADGPQKMMLSTNFNIGSRNPESGVISTCDEFSKTMTDIRKDYKKQNKAKVAKSTAFNYAEGKRIDFSRQDFENRGGEP